MSSQFATFMAKNIFDKPHNLMSLQCNFIEDIILIDIFVHLHRIKCRSISVIVTLVNKHFNTWKIVYLNIRYAPSCR